MSKLYEATEQVQKAIKLYGISIQAEISQPN